MDELTDDEIEELERHLDELAEIKSARQDFASAREWDDAVTARA